MLSKAVHRFVAIPIKTPMIFFTEIEKSILKSHKITKDPQVAEEILSRKAGGVPVLVSNAICPVAEADPLSSHFPPSLPCAVLFVYHLCCPCPVLYCRLLNERYDYGHCKPIHARCLFPFSQ